jgi:hypothetical protein
MRLCMQYQIRLQAATQGLGKCGTRKMKSHGSTKIEERGRWINIHYKRLYNLISKSLAMVFRDGCMHRHDTSGSPA